MEFAKSGFERENDSGLLGRTPKHKHVWHVSLTIHTKPSIFLLEFLKRHRQPTRSDVTIITREYPGFKAAQEPPDIQGNLKNLLTNLER